MFVTDPKTIAVLASLILDELERIYDGGDASPNFVFVQHQDGWIEFALDTGNWEDCLFEVAPDDLRHALAWLKELPSDHYSVQELSCMCGNTLVNPA